MGVHFAAVATPAGWLGEAGPGVVWPDVHWRDVPRFAREILQRAPRALVGSDGYLRLLKRTGYGYQQAPLAQTRWNRENMGGSDRLSAQQAWGIVLHWYGDRENYDRTVKGYLRGFDSLRQIADYFTRTSAHFLVGDDVPTGAPHGSDGIGILQTQLPDRDGIPFVASHLGRLDHNAHKDKKQYFVRALYQLGYADPAIHSMLQDFFDGPRMDPNMRTLAVEITGHDFESPEHFPSWQKIANVVAVVGALMKRYHVRALDLMGHNEIQSGKADPGKKFMALVRYLIGVKALVERDEEMLSLVFGPFLRGGSPDEAVRRYFRFVRDYLVLIDIPRRVFEWEACCGYGLLMDHLLPDRPALPSVGQVFSPLAGPVSTPNHLFLDPSHHEGVDLAMAEKGLGKITDLTHEVRLAASGECLYAGDVGGGCGGKTAIFRHRFPHGGEFLTVYGHLKNLGGLEAGRVYPARARLGAIPWKEGHRDGYLHFAVAYGATWETDLAHRPVIPGNAGPTWIRQRYFSPEVLANFVHDTHLKDGEQIENGLKKSES
jgi:hypothetical protein